MLQLQATLQKNIIEKRRSLRVTCCEGFSHFIIIILLMYGFALSTITPFPAEDYSTIKFNVPPSRYDVLKLINGPLPIPTLNTFVSASRFVSSFLQTGAGPLTLFRQYDNFLYLGSLHFSPDSDAVQDLVNYMNTTYSSFSSLGIYIHESESVAENYILTHLEERTLALIVVSSAEPEHVAYTIRQNYTTLPNTNQVASSFSLGLDPNYQLYFFSGYLTLKDAVDAWAYQYTGTSESTFSADDDWYFSSSSANNTEGNFTQSCEKPSLFFTPYPTPAFDTNLFYTQVGFLLGLALTMSTLYPVSRLVKSIVEEKESKMKEVMEIMGLKPWVNSLAWSITAFALFFWVSVSSAFLCSSSFLPRSNRFLVFMYFFLFNLSEIPFCFLIATFFSKAKIAAIVGPVALFVSLLPRFIFLGTNAFEQTSNKFLASLLSPSAFSFGADILSQYEYGGVGVQTYNMSEGNFSFSSCLGMMFADFLLYSVLAWYLSQVIPSEYGTHRHPLFIFDIRYLWKIFSCIVPGQGNANLTDEEINSLREIPKGEISSDESIELLDSYDIPNIKVGITLLSKRYADGKLAVKKLSLAMIEGQITCLLGHNGAGKTSTISVLTGMTKASSGDCIIFGHRISDEMTAIRQITGVCPQQNVLFPQLTVIEHLYFFGKLKGLYGTKLHDAVTAITQEVGLTEKLNVTSDALSGGMKRKLCLANALVGNPKFVLLDEPTSGMDPYSRRATWELLQRHKSGRVIVLTTHFMDEADILGDRIAIMAEGRLQCSGSSLFLKNRYGAGYVLTMAKSDSNIPASKVVEFVKNIIPSASLSNAVAGEVEIKLPLEASSAFASLFDALKSNANILGISSYGVSITTLEQVFLALAGQSVNISNDDVTSQVFLFHAIWHYIVSFFNLIQTSFEMGTSRFVVDQEIEFSGCQNNPGSVENRIGGDVPENAIIPFSSDQDFRNKPSGYSIIPDSEVPIKSRVTSSAEIDSTQSYPENAEMAIERADFDMKHGRDLSNIASTYRKLDTESGPIDDNLPTNNLTQEKPIFYTQGDTIIQLKELLRKRAIIQSRDANGLFFQVLFPALQILLILAILTITLNPAGRTLLLNASSFLNGFSRPTTLYSAGVIPSNVLFGSQGVYMPDSLSNSRQNLENFNYLKNSHDLSKYLLNSSDTPGGYRMGSYVFNDNIALNISINWTWVKENSDEILINVDYLFPLLEFGGLTSFTLTNANTGNSSGLIAANVIESLNLSGSNNVNATAVANAIQNYLENFVLNTTSVIVSQNVTISSEFLRLIILSFGSTLNNSVNNTQALVQFLVAQSTPESYIITYTGIQYNSTLQAISLLNISVTAVYDSGSIVLLTGVNANIPTSVILNLLPNSTVFYNFSIPSPVTILHNSSSPHGVGIFSGELIESLFQKCSAVGSAENSVSYTSSNHPLPVTYQESLTIQIIISLFAALLCLIPLCYLPASFVTFVVRERMSKSKHLQIVSSVSAYTYWLATFLWDMLLYMILVGCILAALYSYGQSAAKVFIGSAASTVAIFFLLVTYGLSCIPLCYIYSFAFENHATAQISIMVFNFLTGFVAVIAYFIMVNIPSTEALGRQLVHLFRFFPPYNIGEGLVNISANYYYTNLLGFNKSPMAWEVGGRDIIFMLIESIGYLSIVLLTESSYFQNFLHWIDKKRSQNIWESLKQLNNQGVTIDEDVEIENTLIRNSNPGDFSLMLRDISKIYPPTVLGGVAKHAVKQLNLGCPPSERFGLLGINGAGKSTTLGILTGDVQPTRGDAYIDGKPLSDPKTRSLVGYCPQTDPLLDLMTGYETLWFFGRIRGIPPVELESRIHDLIAKVGLKPHAHKPCGTYSGGNKRKLSLAIALVGDPKVLFLDEPSTGMDPGARRHMWEVISAVSQFKSVILTTHSMEECEALCTRIGIMVSGRLQCLGSSQHLKSKFGVSYLIEVRCMHNVSSLECLEFIKSSVPSIEIDEEHGTFLRIKTTSNLDLSTAFSVLERLKVEQMISSYSLCQSTLEQIFIKFAAKQEEETGQIAGLH